MQNHPVLKFPELISSRRTSKGRQTYQLGTRSISFNQNRIYFVPTTSTYTLPHAGRPGCNDPRLILKTLEWIQGNNV